MVTLLAAPSSFPFTTMSSHEHIPSPLTKAAPWPPKVALKLKRAPPKDDDLSVFDILNIFQRRWFLSRSHLLANAISAQKDEAGNFSWVEFSPQYHSHLVKCAVALVPHPVHKVKKVMFAYILELLDGNGNLAFFDLQKGGCKANNAQKEKRRLARKRSRAAKREREREAAKAANLPSHVRECLGCGRKFNSRKTAKKHRCPDSKVVRVKGKPAEEEASQATPKAREDKLPDPPAPHAPTAPIHSDTLPPVTGDLGVVLPAGTMVLDPRTGLERPLLRASTLAEVERLRGVGVTFAPPGFHMDTSR
jgi:hypothetical protein